MEVIPIILKDKVCLITGGTHGIGAASALDFAKHGAHICLVARHHDTDTELLLNSLRNQGIKAIFIPADVSKPSESKRCVEEAIEQLGGLDVLVHSAGGAVPGSILDVSEEAWYSAFDTHVHAIFHLIRAAVPCIKRRGEGAILLISSAAGLRGCLGAAAYGAVKGTLVQMTRILARELANDNIRVNCAAPGVIRTRFQDILSPEQVKNNIENRIPLHREGKPEEVASVLVMLAENDFITGETVTIDGGMTMRIV